MVKKETVKTDTESRILQAAEEEFLLKGLEGAGRPLSRNVQV